MRVMNDLIEKTIDYLARQQEATQMRGTDSEDADAASNLTDSIFVGSVFFVEKLTYTLEDRVIDGRLSGGHLFINVHGFENFLKRRKHFDVIDKLENMVYVYGSDPCSEWPFERAKPVLVDASDPMRAIWFAVYQNRDQAYCLVARRLKSSPTDAEKYRFRGFWTTRPQITHYVTDYLVRVVNSQYGA